MHQKVLFHNTQKNSQLNPFLHYQEENIFINLNIDYMNDFINNKKSAGKGNKNVIAYTKIKSTPAGRAIADKQAAYANVLLIPSMIVLIYLILLIGYFMIR